MGAKSAISLEQYLHTTFPDVDREYRDGEIVERSLPDYLHGRVQAALVAFFWALRTELALFPCVETRMRLRSNLVLIPDVAVFYPTEPSRVPDAPPLLVVEVLSADDRLYYGMVVRPNCAISLLPDHVIVHRFEMLSPETTRVACPSSRLVSAPANATPPISP